jgi:hypothetical protein
MGAGSAELARLRTFRATANPPPGQPDAKKKTFDYSAYKGEDVHAALEKLFHDKCAYCETVFAASAPVDVEHYRPKGAVAEASTHGGYWWLAADWDNLLPSCIDCNRKRGQILVTLSTSLAVLAAARSPNMIQAGKKDSFPIRPTGVRALADARTFADEQPLLIDACRDDPSQSLAYSFRPGHLAGIIVPTGSVEQQERGAVSIQVYGLNRLKLVQDRTRVLRRLEFLGEMAIDLAASISGLTDPAVANLLRGTSAENVGSNLRLLQDRTLDEMKSFAAEDAPYSSMARAWLRDFKTRIATS